MVEALQFLVAYLSKDTTSGRRRRRRSH